MLAAELDAGLQSGDLQSQESQQPPEGRTMEGSLIDLRLSGRSDVPDDASVGGDGLLVGQVVLFEILAGQWQEADAGISSIGEQESRAGR